MEIELRFFANFRADVGQKVVHREYADDSRVGDILRSLPEEYPSMELFESDGQLRQYLTILRNGQDIEHIDGLETTMEDGDELSVFPPVAGG